LALFQKTRRVGIVLDEAHKIKNSESAITKVFFHLSGGFKRRVIMTGTPVANRPYDLWAPIFFLDAGNSLGRDFAEFKRELDLSNSLGHDADRAERFEGTLAGLNAKIERFAVRSTKESAGIVLPEKEIINVPAILEARQRELYEHFKEECAAIVVRNGVPQLDEADEILKRLLRLVEVASNPALVDQSYHREPGKLPVLRSIVDEIIDSNEKAIIWTSFTSNVDWLFHEFSTVGTVKVSGKMAYNDRTISLDRFKHDDETRLLIATPGAAKEGHTLTVANHAIFYDRSFSLDDYLQAQDRIHRISQTRKCVVRNLIADDTIDEWVDALLSAKRLAAMLAQGDITRAEYQRHASYMFGSMIRDVLGLEEEQ
jgi:SNF2 family DNA or RNA helicase